MVEIRHVPVLLKETIEGLDVHPGSVMVDGTLGSGGHSLEILKRLLPSGTLISIDTDNDALDRFRARIESEQWAKDALERGNLKLIHNNFSEIGNVLDQLGILKVNGVLVDLGFSSDQMDLPDRGLSFLHDGPLDMRLNRVDVKITAENVVNEYSEDDLKRIFREYGEEKFSGLIAKSICKKRISERIKTTKQLADIVEGAVPKRYHLKKIHPATKVFQALRMEVNQEIENLNTFLSQATDRLEKNGRLAVISFHSGEDRIVKRWFRENARGCICPKNFPVCQCGKSPVMNVLTKKPIAPTEQEVLENPRSRSAKLRVSQKI